MLQEMLLVTLLEIMPMTFLEYQVIEGHWRKILLCDGEWRHLSHA